LEATEIELQNAESHLRELLKGIGYAG
jgi:hypothetical protein